MQVGVGDPAAALGQQLDLQVVQRLQVRPAHVERGAQHGVVLEQPFRAGEPQHLRRRERVLGHDHVEQRVQLGVDQLRHVVPGDAQVGLGQRHLHVAEQVGEERPLGHLVQLRRQPRLPRRAQPAAQPEPARHDHPRLRPAEHPRDRAQVVQRRRIPARPPRRPRAHVQLTQLVDRRGRGEEPRQPRMPDQLPVRRARGVADDVHRGVPAVERGPVDARRLVHQRRLQHRRQQDLQVVVGEGGQRVLVGDDLALLRELHRRVDGAERRRQHRLRRGPAPAPDRAAAAVEQPQPHAVLGADVAQLPLRPVDLPLRRRDPGALVGVRVAEHDLLQVAAVAHLLPVRRAPTAVRPAALRPAASSSTVSNSGTRSIDERGSRLSSTMNASRASTATASRSSTPWHIDTM